MAYGIQHLKFTFLFHTQNGSEIADTSINYTSSGGWTGAAAAVPLLTPTVLEDIYTAMKTLMQTGGGAAPGVLWADYSIFDGVKVAGIGTDGKYLAEPVTHVPTGGTSQGTTPNILPQSSIVLSLRSGQTLGKGNYGRMYLPHTGMYLVSHTPVSNAATTDVICLAGKNFVNTLTGLIQAAVGSELRPAIMSQAAGSLSKTVAAVAVGNVNDTQRRRRNQLPEVYSNLTLA